MLYQRLKRTWSHNDAHYIPKLKKVFPELKNLSSEELCKRYIELGIEFYTEEQHKVSPIVRLTLPFAIILFVLMFLFIPLNYIFTGRWGYSLGKKNIVFNWFKSLGLL